MSTRELEQAAASMVQGSLSEEITRRRGDRSCACFRDPARRHGPHLYLKFTEKGKARSVYVPPEQPSAVKAAHAAWLRFGQIAGEISASNRTRLLRALERQKVAAKAGREHARKRR